MNFTMNFTTTSPTISNTTTTLTLPNTTTSPILSNTTTSWHMNTSNPNISSTEITNNSQFPSTIECFLPFYQGIGMISSNIFFSLLGTLGNTLLILAISTRPKLRIVSNWFIMNLAIADLLVTMCAQPLLAVLQYGRIDGICMYDIEFSFRLAGNLSCAVSLLTLCIISVERCIVILKPFNHRDILTTGKIFTMLATVWVIPGVYTALRLTISKRITSYLTVVIFGVGYIIIILCYILIFIKVYRHSKRRAQLTNSGAHATSDSEKRLATTIGLVIFFFTISWTPLFYLRMTAPNMNYGLLYNLSRTIALSSSAINFLIYALRNPEFRKAYKELLCCKCRLDARKEYRAANQQSSSRSRSKDSLPTGGKTSLALVKTSSFPPVVS